MMVTALLRLLLHDPVTGILDHRSAYIRGGKTNPEMCAARKA